MYQMHAWDERGLPSVLRPRVSGGRYGCIGNKSIYREALQLDPVSKLANRVERTQLEWPGLDDLDRRLLLDICSENRESAMVQISGSLVPCLACLPFASSRVVRRSRLGLSFAR